MKRFLITLAFLIFSIPVFSQVEKIEILDLGEQATAPTSTEIDDGGMYFGSDKILYIKANGIWVPVGGSGSGHTIQDEGVPLAQRSNLDFQGAGVTVTDNAGGDKTIVTIAGGAAPVASVNGQTGAVVLDADDIDDAATTNKFTTQSDIDKLATVETNAAADQTAAQVPNTPSGNLSAGNVQDALNELQSDIDAAGDLSAANNLSDVQNAAIALSNLGGVPSNSGGYVKQVGILNESTGNTSFRVTYGDNTLNDIVVTGQQIRVDNVAPSYTNISPSTDRISDVIESIDAALSSVGGGGGHIIQDEGTPLTQRSNLDFQGAGVTVTDDAGNDKTIVTISAGGSGANLGYTASPTDGTVTSDSGTDATLPLATGTNAGLLAPADFTKLGTVETNAAADQSAAQVPNTPSGNLVATDVQSALNELQTEIDGVDGDPTDDVLADPGSPTQNIDVWMGTKLEYHTTNPPGPNVDVAIVTDSIPAQPEVDFVAENGFGGTRFSFPIEFSEGQTYVEYQGFYNSPITDIIWATTIDSLAERAFGNSALKTVNVPGTVNYVGDVVFTGVANIDIQYNEGTTHLGSYAYPSSNKYNSIIIPNSVTFIGESAAERDASEVSGNLEAEITSLDLGAGVQQIDREAFRGLEDDAIVFPASLTSIGYESFAFSKLTNIDLTPAVLLKTITQRAFCGGYGTGTVTIPGTVDSVQTEAFWQDRHTGLIIGSGVKKIGYRAFRQSGVTGAVSLPNTITILGGESFAYCPNLTSVNIPASIISWDDPLPPFTGRDGQHFQGSTALAIITFDPGPSYTDIPPYFAYDTAVTSISIPAGVTHIRNFAFYNCTALTTVTIPASVVEIEQNAFNATAITAVSLPTGIVLGTDAFPPGTSITYY